jgi:hypothetical protein
LFTAHRVDKGIAKTSHFLFCAKKCEVGRIKF